MEIKQFAYVCYEEYVERQMHANRMKLDRVWAKRESIQAIANCLKQHVDPLYRGICHGTRRGMEQIWFREMLPGCDVIGTEISHTAALFLHTVQHDFHEIRSEWVGAFDFVYSNSLDHAYDPGRAVCAWMKSLRPGGLCVIEHSREHGPEYVNKNDPFGVTLDALRDLIHGWGPFLVCDIITLPDTKRKSKALIIEAIPC